jgi:3'-phosphoadenosine 5'-phosphosulfate sulfotransferase (PAPS reductase)/FAD synthetase
MREKILQRIREALGGARNPVLAWSSGKDSQLLLYLTREVRPDIPCLWLKHDLLPTQREFAEKQIVDLNLAVFSYPPVQRFVLPTDEGMTFVSDYSIGSAALPVLVDRVHSDRCALELEKERKSFFAFDWDVVLTGWKECDSHPLIPGTLNLEGFKVGNATLHTPLRDLSDEDVWQLVRELNIPVDERRYAGDDLYSPDVIHCCTRCMEPGNETVYCPKEKGEIPVHVWDSQTATAKFRERFA